MEKRKLYSLAICIGIQTLIFIYPNISQAFSYKSAGFDLGLSGSFIFSEIDDGQMGGGAGQQASVYAKFDIKKDYLLKLQWAQVTMKQNLWSDANIDASHSLLETKQRYQLFLAGIEIQHQTWFWEAFSGFNIGKEASYLIKDTDNESHSRSNEKTKSFLVIGGAIGYRMPYKDLHITARLKTFSLLSNVYTKDLGNNDFYFVLPFLMSLGLEF